jgi:hypothetical protein
MRCAWRCGSTNDPSECERRPDGAKLSDLLYGTVRVITCF